MRLSLIRLLFIYDRLDGVFMGFGGLDEMRWIGGFGGLDWMGWDGMERIDGHDRWDGMDKKGKMG